MAKQSSPKSPLPIPAILPWDPWEDTQSVGGYGAWHSYEEPFNGFPNEIGSRYPPYSFTERERAPHVQARDQPPDPTASGPSAHDMEDWYATNSWKVHTFDVRASNAGAADTDAFPVETALELEVEILRKKARAKRRQARAKARAAAAAAAAAKVQTGNSASLRGGGWDGNDDGGGDWDNDDDDGNDGDHDDETGPLSHEMMQILMTPVRRAAGSIGSSTPSTDRDGNPAQHLHTGDDPPPPTASSSRAPPPGPGEPPQPGKYTYGVEFEFLLATKTRADDGRDPHPADDRWLSAALLGDPDQTLYEYTVRNRMADAMRRGGVIVNKSRDATDMFHSPRSQAARRLAFLDSLEPDVLADRALRARTNDLAVGANSGWVPPACVWDAAQDRDANIVRNARALVAAFEAQHGAAGVPLRDTAQDTVDGLAARWLAPGARGRLQGREWDALAASDLRFHWHLRAMDRVAADAEAWELRRRDPRHVEIAGMQDKYRAWQATQDVSVTENGVRLSHYQMPAGYVPGSTGYADPPFTYVWWGGEVISPVYDVGDPDAFDTVQTAARQLRDELRIHKPMSSVGSGLHVHLGHQDGFSLLQLKRLVTLWYAIEESMYSLHRMDRYTGSYCTPMRAESRLAMALFSPNALDKNYNQEYLPNGGQGLAEQYDRYMQPKLPLDLMDAKTKEFVTNVWRYPTITNLNEAMGSGGITTMGLRFNFSGGKRTRRADWCQKQSLEFRQMQGTLDADHVK